MACALAYLLCFARESLCGESSRTRLTVEAVINSVSALDRRHRKAQPDYDLVRTPQTPPCLSVPRESQKALNPEARNPGKVYKAELYGKTVAVKVQRPDVRDQSTLVPGRVYLSICLSIPLSICYTNMSAYMQANIHASYMYACLHEHIHVHMHVCMHACIHAPNMFFFWCKILTKQNMSAATRMYIYGQKK